MSSAVTPRGVEFLEPGTAITSADLDAWEAKTNVKIGSGAPVRIPDASSSIQPQPLSHLYGSFIIPLRACQR